MCLALSVQAQTYSSEQLARRTIERRAVEAAIWGMPIVAMDAIRQGFLRDMGRAVQRHRLLLETRRLEIPNHDA
jgi:hypothetical protein